MSHGKNQAFFLFFAVFLAKLTLFYIYRDNSRNQPRRYAQKYFENERPAYRKRPAYYAEQHIAQEHRGKPRDSAL